MLHLTQREDDRVFECVLRLEDNQEGRLWLLRLLAACTLWAAAAALAAALWPAGALQAALLAAGVAAATATAAALQVTSESLAVLKGVGVLLSSRRRCGALAARQFIDLEDVHSAIIHETLTTTSIHVHLAFLLHEGDRLAVAFPSFSPGLRLLVPIYRELQRLVPT